MEQVKKSLCIECGLCCSGQLFNAVPLYGEETKLFDKKRQSNQFHLIPTRDITRTKHLIAYKTIYPCEHLQEDTKCNIYHKRPKTCSDFKCGILKAYEDDKLSYSSAINKIQEVKKIPHTIKNRLEKRELMTYPQV